MHDSALAATRKFSEKYMHSSGQRIADIGAMDVNGSARTLFANHEYVGFDIHSGPGVNVVLLHPYDFSGIDPGSFDAAISLNTLEHIRKPWLTVREMARIVKPGGFVFLLVPMPNAHRFHAHPIDCWRCYTEGMRGLFEDAGLETLELWEEADHDTCGVGRKRE